MADPTYQFQAPDRVATTNRVNTSGQPPITRQHKGSVRIANILAPGDKTILPVQGSQFYFRVCTNTLLAKETGGVFSPYGQGEGLNVALENSFQYIELANPGTLPVVFELFVGFGSFIDNKLILANNTLPNVAFPTYPSPGTSPKTALAINDLSGTQFTDINGGKWYALSRVAIVISNIDAGVTLDLQKAGSVIPNGPSIAAIFPLTSIRLDVSGNYALSVGGGNINAIVSEIYQSLIAS
jgi:hypothetical protein